MQPPQRPVQLQLFLGQKRQLRGNRRSARPRQSAPRKFAQPALDRSLLDLLDRALHLIGRSAGRSRPAAPRPAALSGSDLRPRPWGLLPPGRPAPAWPRNAPRCSNQAALLVKASAASRRASAPSGSVTASARSSTRSTSFNFAARFFYPISPPQRRLPQLLAQHCRIDSQLLRRVRGKLLPRQLLRHAPDVRQQKIHRLHLLLGAGSGKQRPRPLNQVIGLPPRLANRFLVGLHAPLPDIPVGIEPAFERHNLDR